MSLIERAAQRLEQLRQPKEGQADSAPANTAAPSATSSPPTIEQAANRLRTRPAPPVEQVPSPEPQIRETIDGRREPVMAEPIVRATAPVEAKATPKPLRDNVLKQVSAPSKVLELDLGYLASRGLLTPDAAASQLGNEMRVIKRPLLNNCQRRGPLPGIKNANRIMVTSSLPGEGKSFVSINLAMSIAMEQDRTVLLVDADVLAPALSQTLGLPTTRGLMDLLTGTSLDPGDVMMRTSVSKLTFMPAGTRHARATELLASEAMERLVQELGSRYPDRIIIFDSPPLLAATEPRVLASHMGQVVMVVEAGRTTQSSAQHALSLIESCQVVMTVLNKSTVAGMGGYYGYYGNANSAAAESFDQSTG